MVEARQPYVWRGCLIQPIGWVRRVVGGQLTALTAPQSRLGWRVFVMICGVVAGELRSYGELMEGRVVLPRVGCGSRECPHGKADLVGGVRAVDNRARVDGGARVLRVSSALLPRAGPQPSAAEPGSPDAAGVPITPGAVGAGPAGSAAAEGQLALRHRKGHLVSRSGVKPRTCRNATAARTTTSGRRRRARQTPVRQLVRTVLRAPGTTVR